MEHALLHMHAYNNVFFLRSDVGIRGVSRMCIGLADVALADIIPYPGKSFPTVQALSDACE